MLSRFISEAMLFYTLSKSEMDCEPISHLIWEIFFHGTMVERAVALETDGLGLRKCLCREKMLHLSTSGIFSDPHAWNNLSLPLTFLASFMSQLKPHLLQEGFPNPS